MTNDSQHHAPRIPRILAIASGGGHWVQLLRLRPAFADCDVRFATTKRGYEVDLPAGTEIRVIPDCNRDQKWGVLLCAAHLAWLLLARRPDVVISTGAAPGLIGIWLARRLGIRTIWVDSIANVDELSMSGRAAGRCADLWLTQWEHLARPEGPHFKGSVL